MDSQAMSFSAVKRQVAELAPLAQRMNAASDALTQQLASIEDDLAGLGLGIPVTLADPIEVLELPGAPVGAPACETVFLGFGRHGKRWRLLTYVNYFLSPSDPDIALGSDPEIEGTLLLESPRSTRLAAGKKIGLLVAEIHAEVSRQLAELENVTEETSGTQSERSLITRAESTY